MNKEQQIAEIAEILKNSATESAKYFQREIKKAFKSGAKQLKRSDCEKSIHDIAAEALYNAGYRKTFTSDFASDTQKAFKEGYEKAKEEQTMIYLKFPPIEKIQGYKTYGNKHLKFWRNTVTKDDYIAVVLCGERVSFPATQDGVDKAEKWVNEKRAEIANALKLCEVEE